MTILLDTMYGEELFDDRNCKVALFAVPSKLHNTFDKEMFMDAAASKANIPIIRHTSRGQHHAYAEGHAYRDDLGKWTNNIYAVPEGMLIKVFARKSPGFGRRIITASLFICIREAAAFRELKVSLTQHPKARFQEAIIKGRFDVLTRDQAINRGAKIQAHFAHTFDKEECDKIFSCTLLEAEVEPMSIVRERIVKRANGETAVILTNKKSRAIDFDD